MRVVAVINQKGGVGKTTTTLNLAHALALVGRGVTVIDLDPQAHLTASFGVERRTQSGMDEVLMEDVDLAEVVVKVRKKLKLVPAGSRLGEVENMTNGGVERGWKLTRALEKSKSRDIVLIDCPPSAGLLGMNALFAAKEMLIPVSGDYLALHGLSRLVGIIEHVDDALKRKTKKWLVVTRFHERRRLANEVREKMKEHFPGQVLATSVRETVALAESPSYGLSIFEYQSKSRGAEDYRALAEDFLSGRTCE